MPVGALAPPPVSPDIVHVIVLVLRSPSLVEDRSMPLETTPEACLRNLELHQLREKSQQLRPRHRPGTLRLEVPSTVLLIHPIRTRTVLPTPRSLWMTRTFQESPLFHPWLLTAKSQHHGGLVTCGRPREKWTVLRRQVSNRTSVKLRVLNVITFIVLFLLIGLRLPVL